MGVYWTREGRPLQPSVVALRSRIEGLGLGDQYTAEIMLDSMPWPGDGKMEEGSQRAPRKRGKVSFLEVEEEKPREVVDDMNPVPRSLYSESEVEKLKVS